MRALLSSSVIDGTATGSLRRAGLPLLLLAAPAALSMTPDSSKYKLDFTTELRGFPESALDDRQSDGGVSLALLGRADYEWNGGRTKLAISPFARVDSADDERSHADIREFEVWHRSGSFDLRGGISKVFWGTTEFVHLVDIINQTDAVESIDGEDKLGQPMLNVAWTSPYGVFSAFVLPYFRERTLPGIDGRLRASIPYDQDDAIYESSQRRKHVDAAVRWEYSDGSIDAGIAHFVGTAREPRFTIREDAAEPTLVPVYDQIHQTSIDLNIVRESWIWKLEALHQQNRIKDYQAAIAGFEYTFVSQEIEAPEIGLLLEYAWDSRGTRTGSAFQDDLFLGLRVSLNDVDGSELLAGVGRDLHHGGHFVSVDASRRIGGDARISLKLRMIESDEPADPLSVLRRDDHLIFEYTHYF